MRWLAALLVLAACGPAGGDRDEVLVSAASSLTEAFGQMELAFEKENPDVDVVLNLAGSTLLREQIMAGAPADVFASANPGVMDEVESAGLLAGEPMVFALNRLQIVVPEGNPAGITGLDDLTEDGLLIGLCERDVPCGEYSRAALDRADIEAAIDTEEPSARALLVKLEAGELDAGITYVTDVIASESVEGIDIPDELNVEAAYSIAVVSNGANPAGAKAFISFVNSTSGTSVLDQHGFEVP